MARVTRITEQELDEHAGEEAESWVDSEHLEALIRDTQADPSLLNELDALLPDTIEDL